MARLTDEQIDYMLHELKDVRELLDTHRRFSDIVDQSAALQLTILNVVKDRLNAGQVSEASRLVDELIIAILTFAGAQRPPPPTP